MLNGVVECNRAIKMWSALCDVSTIKQHPECFQPIHRAPNRFQGLGSIQCTSSKIISTGLAFASAPSCAVSASNVFCRRYCGSSSSVG